MRTIIVEDEINNLNLLSHFLKKYCPVPFLNLMTVTTAAFQIKNNLTDQR